MVAGVDVANLKGRTVINSTVLDNPNDVALDEMDVDQLRDFAKQNNVELPFNVKKSETIRKNIEKALAAAEV